MRVLEDDEYRKVWDYIYSEFDFEPSIYTEVMPFSIWKEHRVYKLNKRWNKNDERLVNALMCGLGEEELYALNWQHDCFLFSPKTEYQYDLRWYDEERDVNVCFPSYWPNGDYYFFLTKDFSIGFLGHPWRKEIWVIGEKMIAAFERVKDILDIERVDPAGRQIQSKETRVQTGTTQGKRDELDKIEKFVFANYVELSGKECVGWIVLFLFINHLFPIEEDTYFTVVSAAVSAALVVGLLFLCLSEKRKLPQSRFLSDAVMGLYAAVLTTVKGYKLFCGEGQWGMLVGFVLLVLLGLLQLGVFTVQLLRASYVFKYKLAAPQKTDEQGARIGELRVPFR